MHVFPCHHFKHEEKNEVFAFCFHDTVEPRSQTPFPPPRTWQRRCVSLSKATRIKNLINVRDLREIIISSLHSSLCTVVSIPQLRSILHFLLIGVPVNILPRTIPTRQLSVTILSTSYSEITLMKVFICTHSLIVLIHTKCQWYVYRINTLLLFKIPQYYLFIPPQNCFLRTYYYNQTHNCFLKIPFAFLPLHWVYPLSQIPKEQKLGNIFALHYITGTFYNLQQVLKSTPW